VTKPLPLGPQAGRSRLLVGLLLGAFALQCGIAALRDSITADEFVHLPVGLYMLTHLDFSPDPINPPLARLIPALPLLVDRPTFDPRPGIPHWAMGYHLMAGNVEEYPRLFLAPRMVIIAQSLLLGLLIFHWATTLHGTSAGLVALFLFAFSPSMLANGHLVTADVPGEKAELIPDKPCRPSIHVFSLLFLKSGTFRRRI